jgi:hypothetical protein
MPMLTCGLSSGVVVGVDRLGLNDWTLCPLMVLRERLTDGATTRCELLDDMKVTNLSSKYPFKERFLLA